MPDLEVCAPLTHPGDDAAGTGEGAPACRYCGTTVTDAPACVNCGALIAPQRLGEDLAPEDLPLPPPGLPRIAGLAALFLLAAAIEVAAIVFLFDVAIPGLR